MSSYFSQLMAQSDLPVAGNGQRQSARLEGRTPLREPLKVSNGIPTSSNEPEDLLPEIETFQEAPVRPTNQGSPLTTPPVGAEHPLESHKPAQPVEPEPQPKNQSALQEVKPDFEQDETRTAGPAASLPQSEAREARLPADWLSAFQQARAWVAANPVLTDQSQEPLEKEEREFKAPTFQPPSPLVEEQTIDRPKANPQTDEAVPVERRILEPSTPQPAISTPNEPFSSEEARPGPTIEPARPAHIEQHQELSLNIGSFVVTVEEPPGWPELRPAPQPARRADESRGANRSSQCGVRWQRHYLREY